MSGIYGILAKNLSFDKVFVQRALNAMAEHVGAEAEQKQMIYSAGEWHFGLTESVSSPAFHCYVHIPEQGLHCLIEGQVFVNEDARKLVHRKYPQSTVKSGPDLLPYLFLEWHQDIVRHITGWYNLFVVDENSHTALLCNDRLGLLSLYYYDSAAFFIFASKIEPLLASGLIDDIAFDPVSIAEYLLFNYPVSNNTFIKQIRTLPAAVVRNFGISNGWNNYWSPTELICEAPLSEAKSLDLVDDALASAIRKPFIHNDGPIAATLTGGFDGRLVLSYLLDQYRDRLRIFSFGAAFSPDITIPRNIAQKEGFSYEPVILGQEYMDRSFVDAARKTIELSGGLRSFRRAHYLFAMKHMSSLSGLVVSGNFGDEVIKFAQILPSEVISKAMISFIQSDFSNKQDLLHTIEGCLKPGFSGTPGFSTELNARLESIEIEMAGYESPAQKFHHLKFTRIARGFFGNELSSYNDYMQSYSPFLDLDFLTAFHKTCFAGIYYPFNGNKLEHKAMASNLYTELIRRNKKSLLEYQTDRGYAMKALTYPLGKLEVLFKKFIQKRSPSSDHYFLGKSEPLFQAFVDNLSSEGYKGYSNDLLNPVDEKMGKSIKDKLLSINYWIYSIEKKYPLIRQ